jgi:hypothetical protein
VLNNWLSLLPIHLLLRFGVSSWKRRLTKEIFTSCLRQRRKLVRVPLLLSISRNDCVIIGWWRLRLFRNRSNIPAKKAENRLKMKSSWWGCSITLTSWNLRVYTRLKILYMSYLNIWKVSNWTNYLRVEKSLKFIKLRIFYKVFYVHWVIYRSTRSFIEIWSHKIFCSKNRILENWRYAILVLLLTQNNKSICL